MSVKIAVFDAALRGELKKYVDQLDWQVDDFSRADDADIAFLPDNEVGNFLRRLGDDRRPTFVVTVEESAPELPKSYLAGIADDILVMPPRRHEFMSRVRWHFHLQQLRALEETTAGVPLLMQKLSEDLLLAEKIQRNLIREKFAPISGLSIKSKYWCGNRAGGDYFDVVEFPGSQFVGFLLTDSSSYSLSSSLLGALVRQTMQVPAGEKPRPEVLASQVVSQLEMKEKDSLSFFLGVLDRKSFRLNFVSEGGAWLCRASKDAKFEWACKGEGRALTASARTIGPVREMRLEPEDRCLLFSDGWKEGMGADFESYIERQLGDRREAQKLLNELSFELQKRTGLEEDDMPPQDCSMLVADIDKNILRLAP